jgi:hypothetical protein
MKIAIYKVLQGEEKFELEDKVGTILFLEGKYSIEVEDETVKRLLERLLKQPIKVRAGREIEGKHVTISEEIKPEDDRFLESLKYKMLEQGYWLEIEDKVGIRCAKGFYNPRAE